MLFGTTQASADVYTVQSGDTLNKIAADNQTTVDKIATDNNVSDVNLIYVGEQFNINLASAQQEPVKQNEVDSQTVVPASIPVSGGEGAGYVAQQMATRTGVSEETWAYIIQRESGGNANIRNASSGAFGYLQLLGHGEHDGMSADEQVNMAVDVYNAQGLSAWEVTH